LAKIIKVDFKKKKKIINYEKYQWMCNMCESKHIYDSRRDHNEVYLMAPMTFIQGGKPIKLQVSICSECIKELGESIEQ